MSHADPAIRSLEQRDAIAAATRERRHDACTRRTCTVAEAVSWESLSDKYPQVARLLAENDRIRDAAGQSVVNLELLAESEHRLSAFGARIVLEEAERLRAALTPPRA